MQKVFNLTNRYIVLATPLILYSLISSVYLVTSASGGKLINLLFAILLFFLMTGAFIAGWFNMIKIAIIDPEREDANSLIKEFPAGVGEFFLSSLGAIFVVFIFSTLMLIGSYFIGANTIGDPGISADTLASALKNTETLKTFVTGLSIEQLTKINLWNMLILGTLTLIYYSLFLYMPALFFKNKNPLFAFFISLKDLFSKNILKTTGIFLLIFVINFFISLISTILGTNVFIHFVLTLLNFYFITSVGVGVFYYYYLNFIQPMIGKNVDIEI